MSETVSISRGNRKIGAVPSVSLPPIVTCPHRCEHCYAEKICRIYPNVKESYDRNLRILRGNPEKYWKDVKAAVASSRFFRFHVSGDIPKYEYIEKIVETAQENPGTEILVFTKRYAWMNKWMSENGELPNNLHVLFSGWRDLKMENPYNLPEAHVRYKDGYCDAGDKAVECYGNCAECYLAGCGCWKLGKGEQVVFNEH